MALSETNYCDEQPSLRHAECPLFSGRSRPECSPSNLGPTTSIDTSDASRLSASATATTNSERLDPVRVWSAGLDHALPSGTSAIVTLDSACRTETFVDSGASTSPGQSLASPASSASRSASRQPPSSGAEHDPGELL